VGSRLEFSIRRGVPIPALKLHIGQVVQRGQPELFIGGHEDLSIRGCLRLGGPQFTDAFLDVFIFVGLGPCVHYSSGVVMVRWKSSSPKTSPSSGSSPAVTVGWYSVRYRQSRM